MNKINQDLLNQYNVDAADVLNATSKDLPEFGDNVKILSKKTQTQVLEDIVFLFNFTKGNVIKITKIIGQTRKFSETIARIEKPKDMLEYYNCVLISNSID